MNSLFDWLFDPSQRTHYGYWLSTLAIAFLWASLAWGRRKPYFLSLFSKKYWLNRSTYQDYFIMFFNRTFFLVLGISWLIITLDIALLTLDFLRLFGTPTEPFTQNDTSHYLLISIYTLLLFLLDDASRFLLHRIMHKFDFLWRIHRFHHSASTLTPFTALRLHPLESILYQARSSLIHGICAGLSFFYFGFQLDSWQIWGATIWVLVFNFLGANLRHSQLPISYGRFEKIFISPSMHQAHHGVTTMNNNYGSVLSIWDTMSGSWRSGSLNYKLPDKTQPLIKQLLLRHIDWK